MTERTDTRSNYADFPEGTFDFTILEIGDKMKAGEKTHYRIWKLGTVIDDVPKSARILLFPWEYGDILRVAGAEEVDEGIFEWEIEDIIDKRIRATTYYSQNPKTGKDMLKIKDIESLENDISGQEAKAEVKQSKKSSKHKGKNPSKKKKEDDVPF